MPKKQPLSQEVWTYQYQPFRLGPGPKPGMQFPVKCTVEDGEEIKLPHGYLGFVFENTQVPGKWHVALRPSGALIGYGKSKHHAIADVLDDMTGGDRRLMEEQVMLSIRTVKEAQRIARGDFMKQIGRGE